MSFEEPIWLYLTPIILLVFGGIIAYGLRRRDTLLGRFAASRLLDQLTEQAGLTRTWFKAALILLAVTLISLALARPQLGVEWSERKARGLDIVFVLDSSKSMLATDLRPTRLDRAKLAIIDLVERLESDRIGLIAFAGQAFLQTPPTLDYAAFRESLDAVDPGVMTSGGSDLGNAIKEAVEAFPSETNVKVVVLLTDGEDLSGNAAQAAEAAQEEGIQVFAIGIGTPEGEYLKIKNSQGIDEFVRDTEGQPVRSQLDEATLQEIARLTGGSYSRLSSNSLDQLYSSVLATLPREERESELEEVHIERFQWALSAALAFLVVEILIRRRRNAAIHAGFIIFTALTFSPTDTVAQTQGEAKTDARSSYNSAYEALSSGDYDAAIERYESALSQSSDLSLQRDALYNMAHATYQQGRSEYESGDPQGALEKIKKAESLFESAQEIDPDDSTIQPDIDQVSNVRKAIEKLIEQQKEQEQNEQSDQSEQPDDSEQPDQSEQSDQSDQSEQSDQSDQSDSSDQSDQSDSSDQSDQSDSSDGSDSSDQSDQTDSSDRSDSSDQPEPSDENQAPGTEPESTQDPVDDIPQSQPGEENEDATEGDQQEFSAPEPTEGEASEENAARAGSVSEQAIEGMTEAEAEALLDSLRNRETLLPFIDQSRSGRKNDLRDW